MSRLFEVADGILDSAAEEYREVNLADMESVKNLGRKRPRFKTSPADLI
jgi:hypothetical protein